MHTLLLTLLCTINVAEPLTVDVTDVDRGTVHTGPPWTLRFVLSNRTSVPIQIVEVDAGCGCLRPTLSTKLLKPGTKATLTVTVNTLTQPPGPNRWPIRIRSVAGDEAALLLELSIRATLVEAVTVTPPSLAISTTGEATQQVVVTDRDAKPLTITTATVSNPDITASIESPRSVTVHALSRLPSGTHNATLRITTDSSRCPELNVAVQIVKRDKQAVRAFPSRLVLAFPSASQLVQLRRTDGQAIAIDSAVSTSSDITVSASKGTGPVATLRVRLKAITAGETVVNVQLKDGTSVTIPVSWK